MDKYFFVQITIMRLVVYIGLILQAISDKQQTVSEFLIVLLITVILLVIFDLLERWVMYAKNL